MTLSCATESEHDWNSFVEKQLSKLWDCGVARMEEGRIAFKILTVTPTGMRTLGRPRRRLEDNIRMDQDRK